LANLGLVLAELERSGEARRVWEQAVTAFEEAERRARLRGTPNQLVVVVLDGLRPQQSAT